MNLNISTNTKRPFPLVEIKFIRWTNKTSGLIYSLFASAPNLRPCWVTYESTGSGDKKRPLSPDVCLPPMCGASASLGLVSVCVIFSPVFTLAPPHAEATRSRDISSSGSQKKRIHPLFWFLTMMLWIQIERLKRRWRALLMGDSVFKFI